jgi:putative tryptophan/tyrosine transport system substrate-binding protein
LQAFLQIVDNAGIAVVGPSLLDGTSDADYSNALATMSHQGADALCVFGSPENTSRRRLIVELAAKFRVPAIYSIRPYVEAGGLMSYGADLSEIFRYCARSIDKILKGTKPGDVPYYLPTKFELVINLGTAKALGLSIPSSVLSLADDLLE